MSFGTLVLESGSEELEEFVCVLLFVERPLPPAVHECGK